MCIAVCYVSADAAYFQTGRETTQTPIWTEALAFFSRVSDEREGGISAQRSETPAAVMNCS